MSVLRATVRLFPVLFLLLLLLPTPAQEPDVPEWIKNIDPTKYVLLNKDSTPAFPFHIEGSIGAFSDVQQYEITLGDGTKQAQRSFLMTLEETIAGDKLIQNRTKGGMALSWRSRWIINVWVLETAEVAAAAVKARWGDTFGMDPLKDTALGDPRLVGQGVSSPSGHLVRYRNLVWYVMDDKVEEVKPAGGRQPVPADDWNAACTAAEVETYKLTATLAKRWLDKVAGPPVPDLQVWPPQFDYRGAQARVTGAPFRESAADKQWVYVSVKNLNDALPAKGVQIQLYVQYQGEAARKKLGDPLRIAGDIAPGDWKGVATVWDLQGKPVENAVLTAECFIPDQPDPNPLNDVASSMVSIWFAQNPQGRPFAWGQDTYSFVNTGFQEQELEETVEGVVATILGNIQEAPSQKAILHVMMFGLSFDRVKKYLDESMKAGVGGHCYGMSATAALYFEDPTLKPVNKPVKDMTLAEASTNINIYHRAQMLPLLDALMNNWNWRTTTDGTGPCGNAIKQELVAGKLATVIEFFSPSNAPPRGHAVLAYKYIEDPASQPVVYVYDPNFPEPRVAAADAMSQVFLIPADWQCPNYMGYRAWAGGNVISAHRPWRTISLESVNAVMPSFKKTLGEMIGWFKAAGKMMGVLGCPADAVFTDANGRRVGTVGGKVVNEIPGAEVRSSGAVEIYILPAGQQYTVTVTGTGAGTAHLDLIRAESATTAGVISFQNLPVTAAGTFKGTVAGGKMSALTGGGQSFTPTINGTYDVSQLPTQGTGTVGPTQPDPGGLVVCRNVVDGVAQGTADSFDQIGKVYAYYSYQGLAQKTTARASWKRNGQEFSKGEREIAAGDGWVWFSISTERAGGYEAGQFSVTVTAGNKTVTKSFTIGTGTVVATQPDAGGLVVCRNVVEGVPQGTADHFDQISKVYAFYRYQGLAQKTTARASWKRNGQEFSTGEREIAAGDGWVWFSISTERAGGYEAGQYEVTVTAGNLLARKSFTIGTGPGSAPTGNTFAGRWSTNWGEMNLALAGNKVTGTYVRENGKIEGTVSADGRTLTGMWSEAPSYKAPADAGKFTFTLAADGNSFTGKWGYGDGAQNSTWSGTRIGSVSSAPPEPELIFTIGSLGVAENNATSPSKFTLDRTRTICQIRDYHWNNAKGKTPGTIGLRDAAGKMYGPWPATGADGQGGVKNANWDVFPNVAIPAGTYTIVDSDPATWAQNAETGHRGMCWVYAFKEGGGANATPTQANLPLAITDPTDGQKVEKEITIRGTAPAGARVRVTVKNYFKILVEGYSKLEEALVTADGAGNWATEKLDITVPFTGMAKDYQLIAERLDDTGAVAATVQIKVKGK